MARKLGAIRSWDRDLADGVLHEEKTVLDGVTQVLQQTLRILGLLCGQGFRDGGERVRERERGTTGIRKVKESESSG